MYWKIPIPSAAFVQQNEKYQVAPEQGRGVSYSSTMQCRTPQEKAQIHSGCVLGIFVPVLLELSSTRLWCLAPPASCPAARKVRSGCNWGGLTGGASTPLALLLFAFILAFLTQL